MSSKPCPVQYASTESGLDHLSFPSRTFVAISHAVAALAKIVISRSSSKRATFLLSALLPAAHQMRACVSSKRSPPSTSVLTAPARREGLEERLRDLDQPFQSSRAALRLPVLKGHETRIGLAALGDDDLLAGVDAIEQSREVCLRGVYVYRLHPSPY